MKPSAPAWPAAETRRRALGEAVAAAHLVAMRREFRAIRALRTRPPSPRAREGFWCVMEALLAELRGHVLSQKALAAEAEGLISPPTLSRAIADMEARGFLVTEAAPDDARVRLIRPTPRAMAVLLDRAAAAHAEFTAALRLAGIEAPAAAEARAEPLPSPD